jgi:hypothetical protein
MICESVKLEKGLLPKKKIRLKQKKKKERKTHIHQNRQVSKCIRQESN